MPKNLKTLYTEKLNEKRRIALLGNRSPHWKGDNVGYEAIHRWLRLYSKKTGVCKECEGIKSTDWALIKGLKYERRRENYKELCRKCHIEYDDIAQKGWIIRKLRYGNGFKRR